MTLFINGKTYEADELIAYVKKLEKENAELKKDNEGYDKDNTLLVNRFNQTSAKLTKAEVIIKLLLWDLRNRSYEPVKDVEQAEQFLNGKGCPDVMCDDCNRECELEKLKDSEVEMTNEVFGREEIENRKLDELFSKIEVEDIMKKPTKPRNKRIIDFGELECVTKNKI